MRYFVKIKRANEIAFFASTLHLIKFAILWNLGHYFMTYYPSDGAMLVTSVLNNSIVEFTIPDFCF